MKITSKKVLVALSAAVLAVGVVLGVWRAALASDLVLGPYVTQVNESNAKVLWIARAGAAARCEILGEPNAASAKAEIKIELKVLPLTDVTDVLHAALLQGLPPGQTVRYRVTAGKDKADGSFQTPPPADSNAELRFAIYGDSRSHPEAHKSVVAGILKEPNLAFVVHTGDYASFGDQWPLWQEEFFDPAADMLRRMTFWPVRGNHEGGGLYYRQVFDLSKDRPHYSFDWGNVHVTVLDQFRQTDERTLDGNDSDKMIAWLKKDLTASKAEWKLMVYHEPTYNLGGHATAWGRDDVLPVLEKCGVDLVVAGHSHLYERFRPIGAKGLKPIIHVVTGGGGAPLYNAVASDMLEASYSGLHSCIFRVKGNQLEMSASTPDGRQIDQFNLVKTGGTYQKEILDRALTTEQADQMESASAGGRR